MNDFIKSLSHYITLPICIGAILFALIVCIVLIFFWKKRNELQERKRTIDLFPTFLSTLGVLGTFWGITIGLSEFNTQDLDKSIPVLLEGLKTAFYTSLLGMISSMITNFIINKIYDNYEAGLPSNQDEATARICDAVESMNRQNIETMQALLQSINQQTQNQTAFYNTLLNQINVFNTVKSNLSDFSLKIDEMTLLIRSQETHLSIIASNGQQTINKLDTLNANIEHIDDRIGEQLDISSSSASILQETQDETKRLSEVLRAEVDEIEIKMGETNHLLTQKFDEFAELLKKSNTEALVEVMKQATLEFQNQMNAIVSKLVKENFEQLNQSVEKLNVWQQENKHMISDLTHQYTKMTTEFERTSTVLTNVADYAAQLSGTSGMLAKLIIELQKVMIEDTKFSTITTKLSEIVDLTKANMIKFDDSTSKLNEWVRKQRNFVDGVQLLIKKLEELSSIRDYNKEFWQDTKKQLEEGVGFIKKGSDSLNAQLTDLDKQFYSRLSATLAELDSCIQAMIKRK